MKTFLFLSAVGLVAALIFLPGGRRANATSLPEITTCSGRLVLSGAQTYYFGLKRDGECGVQPFYANSEREAFSCAKLSCPDCEIEDITSLAMGGKSFYQGTQPELGLDTYCPASK